MATSAGIFPAGRTPAFKVRARFGAALLCSLAVHTLFTASVRPGSAVRKSASDLASSPSIAARLVIPVPEAVAEPPVAPPVHMHGDDTRPTAAPSQKRALHRAPAQPAEPAPAGDASGVPHVPDTTYYGARQLDVYPQLVSQLDLGDTGTHSRSAENARVLLLVMIDATGVVDDVSVIESTGNRAGENDARRALLSARFKPAVKDGRPVKSRLLVQVSYGASDSDAASASVSR